MKVQLALLLVALGIAAAASGDYYSDEDYYEYEENYEEEVIVHETGEYAGESHPLYPPPPPPYWYYPPPNPYYRPHNPYFQPYNPYHPPYMPPHLQQPPQVEDSSEEPVYQPPNVPPQHRPPPPPMNGTMWHPPYAPPHYEPPPPMEESSGEESMEEEPYIPPYYQPPPPPPMCCRPFVMCNEYQRCFIRGCMEWGTPYCNMNASHNMTYPESEHVFQEPPLPPGYVPHPVYDPVYDPEYEPYEPPSDSTGGEEVGYPIVEPHPPPSYSSVDDTMDDKDSYEHPLIEPDAPPSIDSMDDPEAPPQEDTESSESEMDPDPAESGSAAEAVDETPPEPVPVPIPPEEVDVEFGGDVFVPSGGDVLLVGTNMWRIPPPTDPIPSMMASVGDTVIFQWDGNHDVYIHPSGTCSTDNAFLVGDESGAWFTFTRPGSYVFACDVGQHCEFGMIMTIEVSE